MRLKNKETRLNLQKSQIDSLVNKGWSLETYKGLQILTSLENDRYYLKIFRDSAAHAVQYTCYRSEDQRSQSIEQNKASYDRVLNYKAESKANPTKSTAANCAAAIREELKKVFPGVKFSVKSENFSMGNSVNVRWSDGPTYEQVHDLMWKYQYGRFDGMSDMYEITNSRDDIPQAKYVSCNRDMSPETREILLPAAQEIYDRHTSMRESGCHDAQNFLYRIFQHSEIPVGATVTGIDEVDSCGIVFDLYRIGYSLPEQAAQPAEAEVVPGTVEIVDYSEKAIAVIGEFGPYYDKLIELGGKYNRFLKCGRGIIFSKKRLQDVMDLLQQPAPAEAAPEAEEVEILETEPEETPAPVTVEPEVETYDSLEELEKAANGGKVVSLFNMCQLINAK